MSGIVGWFSKTLFGNSITTGFVVAIVAVLAMIIIPNMDSIREKLGFETKTSLAVKLAKEKANVDKVVEANDKLKRVNDVLDKTSNNSITAIDNFNTSKDNTIAKADDIVVKRKAKVEVIRKKPKQTTEVSVVDPKLKLAVQLSGENLERVEASKVNSLAIWEAYCSFNNNDNCKTILTNGA